MIAHLYSNEYSYLRRRLHKPSTSATACPRSRTTRPQHIVRLENGLGDVKPVGGGVRELRINVGPGWRVYFIEVEVYVIVLLVGGNKSTQAADIKKARQMVKELKKAAAKKTTAKPTK
ncbi:type II toxin-antitoxin system RelE/ParE family toxin [Janthinobacterium sp. MDB2-8]|uniref:type II toxin-antitoxin system RelE/ParE family toxin n=1 Tax=Janthinobacterium sp. MDB2-8 TaxID=1259338 RepID=UPI003F214F12